MDLNPFQLRSYKDTLGKGAINVGGYNLVADADGFIDAPPGAAEHIGPHGFIPMERPVKAAPAPGFKK